MALDIQHSVKRTLGRLVPPKPRKYMRYCWAVTNETFGRDYFPAHDALDRKLLAHVGHIRGGTFIEAGANDGLSQSNTWHLERRLGWSGLLVEPIPTVAALCRRFRKARVECCALGSFAQEGGTVTMHYGALMTAAEGADGRHMDGGSAASHAKVGAGWVGGKSYSFNSSIHALSTLIDRAGLTRVDLLSLDVEGYEINVLNGIDFGRHTIDRLLIETSLVEEVAGLLAKYGYARTARLSRHDYLFERDAGS